MIYFKIQHFFEATKKNNVVRGEENEMDLKDLSSSFKKKGRRRGTIENPFIKQHKREGGREKEGAGGGI